MSTRVGTGARGFAHSRELHARASGSLAGGVSTAFRLSEQPVPLFCEQASGSRWIDVDGNQYVDFVCGFGPVILGHGDPAVCDAVSTAARRVQQVGGQHEGEFELAELLCQLIPSYDLVRFSVTGSEAVHGAVRLARAATGRPLVVKFAGHYHGWLDGVYTAVAAEPPAIPESLGQSPSAIGDLLVIDWNDTAALRQVLERGGEHIAAVIMEPLACNQGVIYPDRGYLELARELTRKNGSVLIFDEVITGFRLGLGGAQAEFGVTPDLTVVAKAMGNGFPVSAFGGRQDLMEMVGANMVVHAGTYNGGGISVAAALATIGRLQEDEGVYERMMSLGRRLMDGLTDLARRHGHTFHTSGPGAVFFGWFSEGPVDSFHEHLKADFELYGRFAEQMLQAGVRIIPAGRWYLTAAHDDEDIDLALEAADVALSGLR